MDNNAEDHKLLGIGKDSSVEDVKKAYRIKMMLYQQLEDKKTKEDEENFDKVTEAYNRLCNYKADEPDEPDSKFKDFLYYNKEKFFVGIFVIIIVAILIVQVAQNTDVDLSAAMIGNYGSSDINKSVGLDIANQIKDIIKKKVYGIKDCSVTYYQRSESVVQNPTYMANQTALTTAMTFGKIDLLFLDEENYYDYYERGFLYDLTDFLNIQKAEINIPDGLLVKNIITNDGPVYGIRIAGNDLVKQLGITYNRNLILSIYVKSPRREIAFSAIKALSLNFKEINNTAAMVSSNV